MTCKSFCFENNWSCRIGTNLVQTLDRTNLGPVQTFIKRIFTFIKWSYWNVPKGAEFLPLTQIFSSLYLCSLMVLTFDTFNLKRLTRVCDKISTPFCLLLILCYLQGMRLYPVVFDIYHNKWVILNLFLTTMFFFSYKCTCQRFVLVPGLFHCGVCTSPTFVSPMFVLSDFCVRRLWVQCLWVQRLYWYWISKPSWEHSWVPQLKF